MYILKLAIIIIVSLFLLPLISSTVLAQNFDIANIYQVTDQEIAANDIVVATTNGLTRTDVPYDSRIFGVYQTTPILVYKEATESAGLPIARLGDAQINVSTLNGEIKPGDPVTTSPVKGLGMKATQSGYVIGIATSTLKAGQNITYQNRQYQAGLVNVALKIEYAEITQPRTLIRWLEYINAALFRNIQDPEKFIKIFRYIIAGIIAVLSFLIAFFAFARTLSKSIEAIGRNPLATKAIQFSIVLNIVLAIITMIIGLVIVFVIVRV